jgi:hypothetical protein
MQGTLIEHGCKERGEKSVVKGDEGSLLLTGGDAGATLMFRGGATAHPCVTERDFCNGFAALVLVWRSEEWIGVRAVGLRVSWTDS